MMSLWKRLKPGGLSQEPDTPCGDTRLQLCVIGSGDAFGSGGRLQTCFYVQSYETTFLIDCGATALIGMQAAGRDPNAVDAVVLSHLHGDHYAGLVWLIMHAQFVAGRTAPLTIIGPAGTEMRYRATTELLYPGTGDMELNFPLTFETFREGETLTSGSISVLPFAASHPSGSLSAALRISVGGKVIAFSGDTAWVEALVACASEADVFICECYGYAGEPHYHMAWETIRGKLGRLTARRILLTHMNSEMLAHKDEISEPGVQVAHDGLVLDI
jgi:ribonuclease BN (tRNA processing enzyme)